MPRDAERRPRSLQTREMGGTGTFLYGKVLEIFMVLFVVREDRRFELVYLAIRGCDGKLLSLISCEDQVRP